MAEFVLMFYGTVTNVKDPGRFLCDLRDFVTDSGVSWTGSPWEPDRDTIADAHGLDHDEVRVADLNEVTDRSEIPGGTT